jgi:hypothetical protein
MAHKESQQPENDVCPKGILLLVPLLCLSHALGMKNALDDHRSFYRVHMCKENKISINQSRLLVRKTGT